METVEFEFKHNFGGDTFEDIASISFRWNFKYREMSIWFASETFDNCYSEKVLEYVGDKLLLVGGLKLDRVEEDKVLELLDKVMRMIDTIEEVR